MSVLARAFTSTIRAKDASKSHKSNSYLVQCSKFYLNDGVIRLNKATHSHSYEDETHTKEKKKKTANTLKNLTGTHLSIDKK